MLKGVLAEGEEKNDWKKVKQLDSLILGNALKKFIFLKQEKQNFDEGQKNYEF